MKIVVEFEKEWTVNEIKDYIANPHDEKYTRLSDDMYLELAACAEHYATEHRYYEEDDGECDNIEMNESALRSIEDGINDHFFGDMVDDYCYYYTTQTAAHLEGERKNRYAAALKLTANDIPIMYGR